MQVMISAWRMCTGGHHASPAQRGVSSDNSGMQLALIPTTAATLQQECSENAIQGFGRPASVQASTNRCSDEDVMTDDDRLKRRVHSTLQHIICREKDKALSEWMASVMGNSVPASAPFQLYTQQSPSTLLPIPPRHCSVCNREPSPFLPAVESTQPCRTVLSHADPPYRDNIGMGHPLLA